MSVILPKIEIGGSLRFCIRSIAIIVMKSYHCYEIRWAITARNPCMEDRLWRFAHSKSGVHTSAGPSCVIKGRATSRDVQSAAVTFHAFSHFLCALVIVPGDVDAEWLLRSSLHWSARPPGLNSGFDLHPVPGERTRWASAMCFPGCCMGGMTQGKGIVRALMIIIKFLYSVSMVRP